MVAFGEGKERGFGDFYFNSYKIWGEDFVRNRESDRERIRKKRKEV